MNSVEKVVLFLSQKGAHSRSEIARGAKMRLQTVCGAVALARSRGLVRSPAVRYDPRTNRTVNLLAVRRR